MSRLHGKIIFGSMAFSFLFALPFTPNLGAYPEVFSVSGNQIIDSQKQEIQFRGLSAVDPLHQFSNSGEDEPAWDESYYRHLAEWGATLVRIPIHPQLWRTNTIEENFRILDQTLAWVSENRMYAILDFHSIGYPPAEDFETSYGGIYLTSTDEWKQFWRDISRHYRDDKTVAFYELFNEPVFPGYAFDVQSVYSTQSDWMGWRDSVEEMVGIIRQTDRQKIILVGGLTWAYDLSYALTAPVRAENIVYSTHPYPNSNWHTSWQNSFGKLKEKYPVMVTEFGFEISGDKAESKYKGDHRYRDDIMRFLDEKKISWVAWSFSNKWIPALLADKDGNPNEAGHFFRDRLRR